VERHSKLRQVARTIYRVPGTRRAARIAVRAAIQHLPLHLRNRQRLYNFFAVDTVPSLPIECTAYLPDSRQLALQLDLRDDLSRQWYYWGYSGYEREVTQLLWHLVPSKVCVFDIGANIGYHTLLIAALLEGRGSLHAFEPWREVFDWLAQNIWRNGFSCVHTHQIALSDSDGDGQLLLPMDRAYTNASLVPGFTSQGRKIPIHMQRFDTYCHDYGVTRVDLIKLDVEGAEIQVLRGMSDLLDRWRPDIICEVLEPYALELDTFFRTTAYRKFQITSSGLQERHQIVAHPQYRDYYLSCAPVTMEL
jgi:FkbM family methyltransferase